MENSSGREKRMNKDSIRKGRSTVVKLSPQMYVRYVWMDASGKQVAVGNALFKTRLKGFYLISNPTQTYKFRPLETSLLNSVFISIPFAQTGKSFRTFGKVSNIRDTVLLSPCSQATPCFSLYYFSHHSLTFYFPGQ